MPKQVTRQTNRDGEVRYEVLEHLGVIGTYQTGWKKEVNIIEWNGNPSKLDIRDWSPDHQHLSRGVTLHRNEILELLRVLLRNYGQELREMERRERRRESAEPRRSQINASGKPDTELEAGEQADSDFDERNRQETGSEPWSETGSGTENGAAAEAESGIPSGPADADGQEGQTIWAGDTDSDEAAETLFA